MKRVEKRKNPEYMGASQVFGATALSAISTMTAVFMSTMFMSYMTDYAGLGAWGATLATTILLVVRIFDVVNDPIQAYIMDNAKVGKHGKYKPFFLISILFTAVGAIALYSMPSSITKSPVLVAIWVIIFYFLYDIGTSFYNPNLMYRTMTNDVKQRAKLALGPAMFTLVMGIVGAAGLVIVVAINDVVGNYNTSFMIFAGVACGSSALISILGWFLVKERHVVQEEKTERIKISDFFALFKSNPAMVVQFVKNIFSGFIWTMLFATPTYYVKWAFCADLTTGQVNMEALSMYGIIVSMMMLVPLMVGNPLGVALLKLFKGDPIKLSQFNLCVQAVCGTLMFVAQITGIMQAQPVVFFVLMFLMSTLIAADSIPQSTVDMEVMDYTIYKTGKDRSALTGVLSNLLKKCQSAVSSALVGVVLIAIGYHVDSVTGDYVGDLANIPTMLTWFVVIMGLIPAILAVISAIVYRKYPIDNAERQKVQAYIQNQDKDAVKE